MSRAYRPFPYLAVLTELMKGSGYRKTADKFGYLEEGDDPTKRFRTLIRHARKVGFEHKGTRVRFPRFSRDGKPVIAENELTPFLRSLIPKQKAKRVPPPAGLAKIKVVDTLPKGRLPENTLFLIMSADKTTVTLRSTVPEAVVLREALVNFLTSGSETSSPSKSLSDDDFEFMGLDEPVIRRKIRL